MSEWLIPLQVLINDALNYDLPAKQKIRKLAGNTLVLQVKEPSFSLSLTVENEGFVLVQQGKIEPFNALVAGKASDLFAVMQAEDRTAAMMEHQISIEGDTRTFFAIQEVMSHLKIDWEMALADKLGDLAAHVVADGLRFFGKIARNQMDSFQRTSRNFLREESKWFVPTSLWTDHQQSVQKIRVDVDRIQARVRRIKATLAVVSAESK